MDVSFGSLPSLSFSCRATTISGLSLTILRASFSLTTSLVTPCGRCRLVIDVEFQKPCNSGAPRPRLRNRIARRLRMRRTR